MLDKRIEDIALSNGFKLKEQPDGTMALNPYVFVFARELLFAQAEKSAPSRFFVNVAVDPDGAAESVTLRNEENQVLQVIWERSFRAEKSAPLSDTPEGYEP